MNRINFGGKADWDGLAEAMKNVVNKFHLNQEVCPLNNFIEKIDTNLILPEYDSSFELTILVKPGCILKPNDVMKYINLLSQTACLRWEGTCHSQYNHIQKIVFLKYRLPG